MKSDKHFYCLIILADYMHLTASTGLILGVVAGSCNLSRHVFSAVLGYFNMKLFLWMLTEILGLACSQ